MVKTEHSGQYMLTQTEHSGQYMLTQTEHSGQYMLTQTEHSGQYMLTQTEHSRQYMLTQTLIIVLRQWVGIVVLFSQTFAHFPMSYLSNHIFKKKTGCISFKLWP
jgi:hypothetical protein